MTLSRAINETLKWLQSLPILMQHSGGDIAALDIVSSSPNSWDLGPRRYLLGDKPALNKLNQPTTNPSSNHCHNWLRRRSPKTVS